MALKVFVDFDGTVIGEDPVGAFLEKSGGPARGEIVREFHDGRISARERLRREVLAASPLDMAEVKRFLRCQKVDPAFRDFVTFCRARKIKVHIISDGIDCAVREILAANGIDGVECYANSLEVLSADSGGVPHVTVGFPYDDAECTRCGCCARNIMLNMTGDDDTIVYVGDGPAGRCPVHYADIVFAGRQLQSLCQRENISYFEYNSFGTVREKLTELLGKKSVRKRRRAELRRREAFMCE
jgi:2,3-diketo-5-methylthio-1-phosphopentane phosphatase